MSRERTRAISDLSPLVDGYPAWMRGLPECRQVQGVAPERGRWVKILHSLRGIRGETTWREILASTDGAIDPRVVESDLEAMDSLIEMYPAKGVLGARGWQAFRVAVQGCGLDTSCFVWVEPYRMEPPQDSCWRGDLSDVPQVVHVPENYYGGGPHAVWATDGSWFVVSDVDLPYSIVSCSDGLCVRLLSDPVLEAVEVGGDVPLA